MASMSFSFVCFLLLVCSTSGALFAVDLGSEYVKVSMIKPGRVPISIVHNELSKRKTAAAIAFQTKTRLYGEDALGVTTKIPQRVFLRIRDFLGRNTSDPLLENLFGANPKWIPPYTYLNGTERDTIQFDIGNDVSLATEEILGSLFSYLKSITKEEAGEEVTECVIAVPAFFGPVQKRRILDAAKLAEITVLAMIHSHGAAALQYGIERDFTEKPQQVVIYDMGANTIQASLMSYSAYESKQIGKKLMVGQFEVQDVTWLENMGGDHLDWALVHYFAERFNQKFNLDLYTSSRSVMKLKKAVGKTKHILSANSEAHIFVEEIFDGKDFQDKITRKEFEELNQEFFTKAAEPLKLLLGRNKVDVSSLTAVELIGGGTRVPRLQSVLSEALGSRSLDRHLDGDEAVVMGAGLVAANLSTIFRLRQFGYLDGIIYPMQLQILESENWKPVNDVSTLFRPKQLLPYMKRLPSKRIVNLHNISDAESLQFQIKFNTSDGRSLPPGAPSDLYATYNITGIQEAAKKYGEGGKIVLHFVTDLSGLLDIDRAEYTVEVTESEPPTEAPESVAEAPASENENTTTAEANAPTAEANAPTAEANAPTTEANSPAAENTTESTISKESKPKKSFKKGVLTVSEAMYTQPDMTPAQFKASRAVLRKYARGETQKKETEKAKNTLESYIVQAQNKVHDDLEVQEVTTAEQREEFLTQLTSAEDWLYMDGADAPAETFEKKKKELEKLGDPIFNRAMEHTNRPLSVEQCKKNVDVVEKALHAWPEMKPWLKEELEELAKETSDLRNWLEEKEEEQSQLEPHETPVFTSLDVLQRLFKLEKLMKKVGNKKPPKPKPPPANATTDTNTTANATTDTNNATTADTNQTEKEVANAKEEEDVLLKEAQDDISEHVEL